MLLNVKILSIKSQKRKKEIHVIALKILGERPPKCET